MTNNNGWGKLTPPAEGEPPFVLYFKTFFTQTWEAPEHTKKKPAYFVSVYDSRIGSLIPVYGTKSAPTKAMVLAEAQGWIGLETAGSAHVVRKPKRRGA
jgi:hypothetical protein